MHFLPLAAAVVHKGAVDFEARPVVTEDRDCAELVRLPSTVRSGLIEMRPVVTEDPDSAELVTPVRSGLMIVVPGEKDRLADYSVLGFLECNFLVKVGLECNREKHQGCASESLESESCNELPWGPPNRDNSTLPTGLLVKQNWMKIFDRHSPD